MVWHPPTELAWWTGGQGGGARARGGCKGFGSGGVGGRGTGPRDSTKRRKWRTHRSWPGGRGGRPRALIPGEGSGKVAWQAKAEHPPTELAWWTGGQGGGARARGVALLAVSRAPFFKTQR